MSGNLKLWERQIKLRVLQSLLTDFANKKDNDRTKKAKKVVDILLDTIDIIASLLDIIK